MRKLGVEHFLLLVRDSPGIFTRKKTPSVISLPDFFPGEILSRPPLPSTDEFHRGPQVLLARHERLLGLFRRGRALIRRVDRGGLRRPLRGHPLRRLRSAQEVNR